MIRSAGYSKSRAKEVLTENKLDAYVVGSPENVFYVSGFPIRHSSANPAPYVLENQYPAFCVIDREGEVTLVAWMAALRDREFDVKETVPTIDAGGAIEELLSAVGAASGSNAAVGVDRRFPAFAYSSLIQEPKVGRVVVDENPILKLRLKKSAEEKSRILKGTDITERAIESAAKIIKEGASDLDIILASKRVMMELGADACDHATIPIGDSNPEIPDGRVIKRGDIVGLDLGAIFSGYSSDTHRKFAVGDLNRASVEMQTKLIELVTKCGHRLRPGQKFSDIYNYAASLYEEAGISFVFPNVGHSIGIQTEEANLSYDSPFEIQDDMVINVELYGASEGAGFMGLEDTFLVESGTSRRVTKLPQEITVV